MTKQVRNIEELTFLADTSANPILYLGEAPAGSSTAAPAWRISKVDTNNPISIKWADGNSNYDNIWDNRAGLVYL